MDIGIVGLPNSGKSTLFNALLKRQIADVGEYPFTTVEPNTGVVKVADERLDKLSKALGIDKIVPAAVKFYDIAGLIKGAHEGEGLGNQFLSQIRQVDAILHLVRGFSSPKVPHVMGQVDPVHDLMVVNLELTLADFEVVAKGLVEEEMKTKRGQGKSERLVTLKKLNQVLGEGRSVSELELSEEEKLLIKDLNLLTLKPILYVLNLDESAIGQVNGWDDFSSKKKVAEKLPPVMLISAKLEAEINELSEKEQQIYLRELEIKEPLLDRLIKKCFSVLDLITFFTVKGGHQVQAWPLRRGKTILEAAELIHTDLAEGFINAEVIIWNQLAELGSWVKARDQGEVSLAGKDHVVKEGEVIEIISRKGR